METIQTLYLNRDHCELLLLTFQLRKEKMFQMWFYRKQWAKFKMSWKLTRCADLISVKILGEKTPVQLPSLTHADLNAIIKLSNAWCCTLHLVQ